MSPTKFHDHDHPKRSSDHINGPRPAPLKLNKDSHTIHKPSSSSISVSGSAQQPRNGPVIIYTQSPKVIHTQARDFMALVQRLTGLSSRNSDHDEHAPPPPPPPPRQPQQEKTTKPSGGEALKSVSPVMKPPANTFLADIPLFTPNSTEHFFCSPKALYRFSETTTNVAANCNNPISPSLLEFLKSLPEY